MFSQLAKTGFTIIAFCLFAIPTFGDSTVSAQTFEPENFTDKRFLQYEQQLNAILKTRRDEERKFVNEIVIKVREGKLPSKLVQTSFKWVQQKRPNTNFPFIYFEKVLRIQANKAGIAETIPPYDFGIYRQFDNGVRRYQRGGSKTAQGPGLSSDRTTFSK
ncbi:hypothetical protein [Mariniblastus fucicola]|uniref:Uncharacterized protein n=1 Tax=Mariniblastus fucicola TaxID=980251 RepID=A0A5B9PIY2_9BACT|nr:hypothetical protein [Mariniblastus fucicola]QEG22573.1 hypothetical protein MFFC18_24560 [Mariniblastus fucicola]